VDLLVATLASVFVAVLAVWLLERGRSRLRG